MKRLLVVDDEDNIREIAQLCLELAGWEVLTASSGAEGLACAENERPDAVLLDVMMPGLDGPSTFQRLQDNPLTQSIPVILLTAKVQGADRRRFADLGVHAVLAKPFDPLSLADTIAAALGWSS